MELQTQTVNSSLAFSGIAAFEAAQRMAKCLISSDLVPEQYRGGERLGNAIIALEMAQRIGASPLAVMQNLHVIEGRPSWSSAFIIAALNACGKFSPLRFKVTSYGPKVVEHEISYWDKKAGERKSRVIKVNLKDNKGFIAYAIEKATGETLEGPEVTFEMAVMEQWWTKPGSKWVTMPDLMGRYRAAAFFGRLYAPDVLSGMHSTDEVADSVQEVINITPVDETTVEDTVPVETPAQDLPPRGKRAMERLKKSSAPAEIIVEPEIVTPQDPELQAQSAAVGDEWL
jgi:hypothetical protein